MAARAEYDVLGNLSIQFRYDAEFVAVLKEAVPSQYRSWRPTTKQWHIDLVYARRVVNLLCEWFSDVDVIPYPRYRRDPDPPPLRPSAPDPYAVLHLRTTAPPELVDASVRCLARINHPDTKPEAERTQATRTMQAINVAADAIRTGSRL